MKKIITYIIFFIFFLLYSHPSFAQTPVSGHSAGLKKIFIEKKDNNRTLILKEFLKEYNSSLVSEAQYIIDRADEYQIPWSLLVAISGVESTFCKFIPQNSYNCWGWNNGITKFNDYRHAIETVSKTIRRSYFDKGLDTPCEMSHVYAPPSQSWGRKVQYFMDIIENSQIAVIAE